MQTTKNWQKCSLRYILCIQYQGYVMNINRGKAKIKFMYVGAALSLMAVPNAAKPTS